MKQLPLIPEYTVCIDWAIGPKMRVAGIKCPCPKCSPGGTEEEPGVSSQKSEAEGHLVDKPPARRIPFDAIRDGIENKED